jgi:DNA-binding CsgD family transcriptional regulator
MVNRLGLHMFRNPGEAIGHENREAIRALMSSYLGIKNIEIAVKLNLSVEAVGRHVNTIRAEWKKDDQQ